MPTILLVEDNDDHAMLARSALLRSDHGFEVDRSSSAEECLVMLGKKTYDAIALDYSMPKRNGIETLRDIMGMQYDAPVIMMTGYGDEELAARFSQAVTKSGAISTVRRNRASASSRCSFACQ